MIFRLVEDNNDNLYALIKTKDSYDPEGLNIPSNVDVISIGS